MGSRLRHEKDGGTGVACLAKWLQQTLEPLECTAVWREPSTPFKRDNKSALTSRHQTPSNTAIQVGDVERQACSADGSPYMFKASRKLAADRLVESVGIHGAALDHLDEEGVDIVLCHRKIRTRVVPGARAVAEA